MGFSFGCISSLELVVALVRPLWVAALSRIIIVVAEDLRGRMAKLLCSLELIWLLVCLVRAVVLMVWTATHLSRIDPGWLGKPTRM